MQVLSMQPKTKLSSDQNEDREQKLVYIYKEREQRQGKLGMSD